MPDQISLDPQGKPGLVNAYRCLNPPRITPPIIQYLLHSSTDPNVAQLR
jgi:hypothetical protein